MFPAVPAAPFARNVACREILVKCFFVFKIYYVLLSIILPCSTISVTSRGSDKPVCPGGVKVRYRNGCPRSITIISTCYYGKLRSAAVSCVLTKVLHVLSFCQGQLRMKRRHQQFKAFYVPLI